MPLKSGFSLLLLLCLILSLSHRHSLTLWFQHEGSLHLSDWLDDVSGPDVHQSGLRVLGALSETIQRGRHVHWGEREREEMR